MSRINIFENLPGLHDVFLGAPHPANTLMMNMYYVPGSISLNTLAFILGASGTTAKTLSLSFGMYSLNGATLSLANSASFSSNPAVNMTSWMTFQTISATQDVTPGEWYFAFLLSTAGNSNLSLLEFGNYIINDGIAGGKFFRGYLSVSTNALPVSLATSDMIQDGNNLTTISQLNTYILITA